MTDPTLNLIHLNKEPRMDPISDPSNSAVKPAWKSTEFWLSLLAVVIGYLLTSGVLSSEDEQQARIIKGLVAVAGILGALGYTGLRTSAKNRAVEGATAIAIAKATLAAVPTMPSEPK